MSNRGIAELNDDEDHRYSCNDALARRFVELRLYAMSPHYTASLILSANPPDETSLRRWNRRAKIKIARAFTRRTEGFALPRALGQVLERMSKALLTNPSEIILVPTPKSMVN